MGGDITPFGFAAQWLLHTEHMWVLHIWARAPFQSYPLLDIKSWERFCEVWRMVKGLLSPAVADIIFSKHTCKTSPVVYDTLEHTHGQFGRASLHKSQCRERAGWYDWIAASPGFTLSCYGGCFKGCEDLQRGDNAGRMVGTHDRERWHKESVGCYVKKGRREEDEKGGK